MRVEFAVGSRLVLRFFSPGTPFFLPSEQPIVTNSNLTEIEDPCDNQLYSVSVTFALNIKS